MIIFGFDIFNATLQNEIQKDAKDRPCNNYYTYA